MYYAVVVFSIHVIETEDTSFHWSEVIQVIKPSYLTRNFLTACARKADPTQEMLDSDDYELSSYTTSMEFAEQEED